MDTQPEQTTYAERCTPGYGHWKYKEELSKKNTGEKTEASIKFMCDVWGYQCFIFAAIMVALVFHKQAYDFLKNRTFKFGPYVPEPKTDQTKSKE